MQMRARIASLGVSGALFLVLGGLALKVANHASQERHNLPRITVSLKQEAPVYDVMFRQEVPLVTRSSGGGAQDPAPKKALPFGNALEMAPTESDTSRMRADLDPDLMRNPGLIFSDSADGRGGRSGSGGGVGGGTGSGYGTGQGPARDHQLLSANSREGLPLKLEEMTVNYREIPLFPKLAKIAHLAGNVVVQVLVSENGMPIKTNVVSSANEIFTTEVLRVMPYWRFKPTVVDGEKVRVRVRVLFVFTYEEMATAQ